MRAFTIKCSKQKAKQSHNEGKCLLSKLIEVQSNLQRKYSDSDKAEMERVKAKLSKISSIKTRSLLCVLSDHDTGIVEHAVTSTVNILRVSK